MRRLFLISVAPLLALAPGACGSVRDVDAPALTVSGPAAITAQALLAGAEAEASGDAEGLRQSAGILAGQGAVPKEDSVDLALRWAEQAAELGAATIPPRGRTAGPAYRNGELSAEGQTVFSEIFHSGRTAVISLAPRNQARMLLSVTTDDGRELCEQAGSGLVECRWTPIWTEPVRVEVANLSGRTAQYFLVTN